jgi:hypothetical protein
MTITDDPNPITLKSYTEAGELLKISAVNPFLASKK